MFARFNRNPFKFLKIKKVNGFTRPDSERKTFFSLVAMFRLFDFFFFLE